MTRHRAERSRNVDTWRVKLKFVPSSYALAAPTAKLVAHGLFDANAGRTLFPA